MSLQQKIEHESSSHELEFESDQRVEFVDLDTYQPVSSNRAVPRIPGSRLLWTLATLLSLVILILVTGVNQTHFSPSTTSKTTQQEINTGTSTNDSTSGCYYQKKSTNSEQSDYLSPYQDPNAPWQYYAQSPGNSFKTRDTQSCWLHR